MEKLNSFLEVHSCHMYIYRALFYQNYEFYFTLGNITVYYKKKILSGTNTLSFSEVLSPQALF